MSNTTTTTEATTRDLIDVDPATLIIGANVRTDTHPDAKEFAKSIKERGVLQVIDAYLDVDGSLVVLRGQRRTLAAAEVGTPTGEVPVRVVSAPDEADRIVDQLSENLHREAMHEREVIGAVEQLSLIGVSAAQIAKRTTLKRPAIETALAVAGSPTARENYDSGTLTLDQAASLAEFEGDDSALERLQPALQRGWGLQQAAQQIRNERTEREAESVEVEKLRGKSLPVLDVDEVPEDLHAVLTTHLRDAEGNAIPEETWPTIEGAILAVTTDWTNAEVEEDGETYHDRQRLPVGKWIVPDPGAAGLTHYSDLATDADGTPLAETEVASRKEAEREDRRKVREFNKAWRAAETIRRDWMREFFGRKSAPTGAESLICEAVLTNTYDLGKAFDSRHKVLLEVLGEKVEAYYGNPKACEKFATRPKTPKGFTMRTLAAVVAAWEARTDTHTWRNPSAWDARILGALIEWGYEASPVERVLLGENPDIAQIVAA